MKLAKQTRRAIYAAAPGSIKIPWPEEPQVGRKHVIQSSRKAGNTRLVILARERSAEKWLATVRLEGDPVRMLDKSGGYTDFDGRAMSRDEPEAVSAEVQNQFSVKARLKRAEELA